MARGDGGKCIFSGKEDHLSFLHWLGRVCGSHGWRVHAWVLMGNHFHLLLAMGGRTYARSLIHRLLRDAKERRTLAAHERALDAESAKVEK